MASLFNLSSIFRYQIATVSAIFLLVSGCIFKYILVYKYIADTCVIIDD